ncbi:hypothetical protein KUW19_00905 [Ferrimonas balearica]|uniref:hypothetical protein n=1 Tax=Ferrimonas balearica TaxID=44012 RepID=UPI001C95B30A|nr:hypothetical protein [Ferrimonas balearica]MBY6105036.1 hypothetical protein [Ferrimonas balearica]
MDKYSAAGNGLLAGFNAMEARSGRLADQDLAIKKQADTAAYQQGILNKYQQDYEFEMEKWQKDEERLKREQDWAVAKSLAPELYERMREGKIDVTDEEWTKFAGLAKGSEFDPELLINSDYRASAQQLAELIGSGQFRFDDENSTAMMNKVWGHLLGDGKEFQRAYLNDEGALVFDLNVRNADGTSSIQPMTVYRSSNPNDMVQQADPQVMMQDVMTRALAARMVEQNKGLGERLEDHYYRGVYTPEAQAQILGSMDDIEAKYLKAEADVGKPYMKQLDDLEEQLSMTREPEQQRAIQQQIAMVEQNFLSALEPYKQHAINAQEALISGHNWMYRRGLLQRKWSAEPNNPNMTDPAPAYGGQGGQAIPTQQGGTPDLYAPAKFETSPNPNTPSPYTPTTPEEQEVHKLVQDQQKVLDSQDISDEQALAWAKQLAYGLPGDVMAQVEQIAERSPRDALNYARAMQANYDRQKASLIGRGIQDLKAQPASIYPSVAINPNTSV